MPTRETPSYSSSRVQRASRLNSLEQVRLQQRLMLLEKARLHQARLTNQDIRLTSLALDYILNCSGHSPEGRGPTGEQGGAESTQTEDPCFLYGERVVSRKVRRMPRPHSAVERATFRRTNSNCTSGGQDSESSVSGGAAEESASVQSRLPPRPQSSPAKGRSWRWSHVEADDASGGSDPESERPPTTRGRSTPAGSRPATGGSGGRRTPGGWGGRTTPHQAWEDDTDEVTKRILQAQQQQQQQQQQHHQQQQDSRRSNRYMQDISRMHSQTPSSARGFPKRSRGVSDKASAPLTPSPSPRAPSPSSPVVVIEDRKPVSPRQKRAKSAGRRAGLTEILSQSRATMSASAWRSHLASTQTVPRSMESQRQVILDAKRDAERTRQQHVRERVESFIGQLRK
ncbi:uncharacterized protein LOC143283329 [Babylonia areolata]|uniref:uncharacterized protein LOC143283329 n=1 Tax=Babylonia areolata TaxID=304850 RepID=UPI003FD403E8